MAERRFTDEHADRLAQILVTLRGELELLRMRLTSGSRGTDISDLQRLASDHAQALAAGLNELGSTSDESDIRTAALNLLADLARVERELSRTVLR